MFVLNIKGLMATITLRKLVLTKNVMQVTPFPLIPKKKPIVMPKLSTDVPPHFKLILHNKVDFQHKHTVQVITSVIHDMTILEAQDKASEAFLTGQSLLRVCPEEIAFSWCKEINEKNVKTTLEPVDFF